MKWLFAVLVLANIGLWMWASWYKETSGQEARQPRPPVAAEKMRLLSERGVRLKIRRVRPAPSTAPPPDNPTPAKANHPCIRIGPFAELKQAMNAGKKLEKLDIVYEGRTEKRKTVAGYRVFLPPFPSQKAAMRKRKELTRLGFRDHALIQEEGMRNAISLGLFKIEANANQHLRRLAAKGVKAKKRPVHSTKTVYWLEASLSPGRDKPGQSSLESLKKERWGVLGIKVNEGVCAKEQQPSSVLLGPTDAASSAR